MSASIAQDVSGLDDRPQVTLSAIGSVAYENEELTGNFNLILAYAGRRFVTNGLALNVFEALLGETLNGPLIVTNQDDAVLTLN